MRAIQVLLLGASALALGGCGLALDYDPPDLPGVDASALDAGHASDGGLDAAVDPELDGGASDGGVLTDAALDASREDAGAGTDAGASDAGVADAGMADAGARTDAGADAGRGEACRTSSTCEASEYCARPLGRCFGEGVCRPRATACPDVREPVCGCDWQHYSSACHAAESGIDVMQPGTCPTMPFVPTEWCSLIPLAGGGDGCARCFDDADCGALFPICVASACVLGGEGVCAGDPGDGYCHDRRQCRATEVCVGAVNDVCLPMEGRCEVP